MARDIAVLDNIILEGIDNFLNSEKEKQIKIAVNNFEQSLRESIGTVAMQLANQVSYESLGNRLRIEIEYKGIPYRPIDIGT